MLTPSWADAHSDLLLLSFLEELKPDIAHWGQDALLPCHYRLYGNGCTQKFSAVPSS
jgi:hypothetical protein